MNKQMLRCLGLILCLMVYNMIPTNAQKHEESFSKTANFGSTTNNKVLIIDNINGHLTVEGYEGTAVKMDVDFLLTAESDEDLEEGKKDLKFTVEEQGDTIFVYIQSPYMMRKRDGDKIWWNWQNQGAIDYTFNYDIRVKAPRNIDLVARTINDGNLKVKGIYANKLHASNVNGDVFLEDVTGTTRANTVNGVVEVSYKENPPANSKYSTVNGDVTIYYKKDLSANLKFKSMHGEFFTEFNVSEMPVKVEKEQRKNGTTRFIVNKYTGVTVGKGDISYKFETLNGDIYIKKQ